MLIDAALAHAGGFGGAGGKGFGLWRWRLVSDWSMASGITGAEITGC